MTKLKAFYVNKGYSKHYLTNLNYKMLSGLNGESVVEVVIGDSGPGIRKTLINSYLTDESLHNKIANPTHCELIVYAFEYQSTRRSTNERLSNIMSGLSKKNSVPPTGLFQLKQLVREYNGIIQVRSGTGIVAFDYSKPGTVSVVRSDEDETNIRLRFFPGVQYRILFPSKFSKVLNQFSSGIGNVKVNYSDAPVELVKLKEFFPVNQQEDLEEEGKSIQRLLEKIQVIDYQYKENARLLVLDFDLDHDISVKAQYLIVMELINRITKVRVNLIINAPENLKLDYTTNRDELTNRYLLVMFNKNFNTVLIGTDQRAVLKVFNVRVRDFSTLLDDGELLQDKSILNIPILLKKLINTQKKVLQEIIFESGQNVFKRDAKVLLLSEKYSHGYIEVNKIIHNKKLRSVISKWLLYNILIENPKEIITLGSSCGELMNSVIDQHYSSQRHRPNHIVISTMGSGKLSLLKLFSIKPGSNVIVNCDVIGTGITLKNTLKQLKEAKVLKILTLVDARTHTSNGSQNLFHDIEVESIKKFPLKYTDEIPDSWTYSEIQEVDPISHALLENNTHQDLSIWKNEEIDAIEPINEMIDTVAVDSNAFIEGHFSAGSKHLTFAFDIPRISMKFSSEISTIIYDRIRSINNKKPSADRHSKFVCIYPKYNLGVDSIARKFERQDSKNISSLGLSKKELITKQSNELISDINDCYIIFDDAFESGDTIFDLLNFATYNNAKYIYIYILINRASSGKRERLTNIKVYGNSKIEDFAFLSNVEMPTYTKDNCPVCQKRKKLESILAFLPKSPKLKETVLKVYNDIKEIDLIDALKIRGQYESNFLSVNAQNKFYSRWMLQKTSKHIEIKNYINSLFKFVSEHENILDLSETQIVLSLFEVIDNEELKIFGRDNLTPPIVKNKSIPSLLKIVDQLLEYQTNLSGNQLISILKLIEIIDIELNETIQDFSTNFFSSLNKISSANLADQSKIEKLIIFTLTSKLCNQHPTILSKYFTVLKADQNFKPFDPRRGLVEEVIAYWKHLDSHLGKLQKSRINALKDIKGGRLHNLNHLTQNIRSLKTSESNHMNVVENWRSYNQTLLETLTLAEEILTINESPDVIENIHKAYEGIITLKREGDSVINEILALQNTNNIQITSLRNIVDNIAKLLFEQKGILPSIDTLEVNLKHAIYKAVGEKLQSLAELNRIKIEYKYEKGLFKVFGQDMFIVLPLQNVIENALVHSNCSMVEIEIKKVSDVIVTVVIRDNGSLDWKNYSEGTGISEVRRLLAEVNGKLTMKKTNKHGYKTEACIEYSLLKYSIG